MSVYCSSIVYSIFTWHKGLSLPRGIRRLRRLSFPPALGVVPAAVLGRRRLSFRLGDYFPLESDRDVVFSAFLHGADSQGASAVVRPKRARFPQIRLEIPKVAVL